MGRKPVATAVAALALISWPSAAAAHPLGAFSVSVSSELVVEERQIRVRWVLDMAEIPSATLVQLIDANADGTVTHQERDAYFNVWATSLLGDIQLWVDGEELVKQVADYEFTVPSGEGGSPALRVVMDLTVDLPEGDVHHALYRDDNYADYPGWREVAVAAGEGMELIESSVPTEGRTEGLTVYPPDLGVSVPTSEAAFSFQLQEGQPLPSGAPAPPSSAGEDARPGFQLWPTGVLAVLMLGMLAAVMLRAGRGGKAPR